MRPWMASEVPTRAAWETTAIGSSPASRKLSTDSAPSRFESACPSCKLDYKFLDTGDGPAVFAIMILGGVVLGGALWFEFRFNPPVWQHIALWGVLTPLLALGLLRLLKAGLAVLQYKNRAEEGRLAKD